MLDKNRDLFHWLNISAWHDAGYTGTRGLTATQEGWDTTRYNYKGLITMGDTAMLSESAHPINTAKCFFEIAPDRKLIQLPYKMASSKNSTEISSTFFTTVFDAVKRLGVDIMFGAIISTADGKYLDPYLSQVAETFTYYMNTSNDNGSTVNKMISAKYIYGIGSYVMDERTAIPSPIGGEEVINASLTSVPTHLYIPYANGEYKSNANCRKFSGASCSSSILAGMMSLVNDFFIEQTGLPLSSTGSKKFIKTHSTTIGNGFRLFRLPDPESINVKEFTEDRLSSIYDIADGNSIDPELVDEVLYVINRGYMHLDEEGNFNPNNPITNIKMAEILAKILRDNK